MVVIPIFRSQDELVWYTRNIGLRKFMGTEERATLSRIEEDDTVRVRKQCWIDSSIVGFRSAIKNFGVGRYQKNCGPATRGFQTVVEEKMRRDKEESRGQPVTRPRPGEAGSGGPTHILPDTSGQSLPPLMHMGYAVGRHAQVIIRKK